jgi:hypothetical protein
MCETWGRIHVKISIMMMPIRTWKSDPDRHQNDVDPQHCLKPFLYKCTAVSSQLFNIIPSLSSSLAYSNIMAEWLSDGKHNRVYLPEEPFLHGNLIRSGRLKSFQHLHVRSEIQLTRCLLRLLLLRMT